MLSPLDEAVLPLAAHWIREADAIVVCSGAGLGVASGLGTFRGRAAGVWPPLQGTELSFQDMSCPTWFDKPAESIDGDVKQCAGFGYAFWQYRYQAYTRSIPHQGYEILRKWIDTKTHQMPLGIKGGFSFTSNIDGAWRRVGLDEDQLYEVHGSLDYMQCVGDCLTYPTHVWSSKDAEWDMEIDPVTHAVKPGQPLPMCPFCHKRARPNVMMFEDYTFDSQRVKRQDQSFYDWLDTMKHARANIVIIEIGAGVAIPTVRDMSEQLLKMERCSLLRINPEHPEISTQVFVGRNGDASNRLLSMTSDSLAILTRLDQLVS